MIYDLYIYVTEGECRKVSFFFNTIWNLDGQIVPISGFDLSPGLENSALFRNGGWENRKALAGSLQSVISTSVCTSFSYILGKRF